MKHTILLCMIACATITTFAQTKSDTTQYLRGRVSVISKEKEGAKKVNSISLSTKKDKDSTKSRSIFETSYASFDIGFNNYSDQTDYLMQQGWSADDKQFFSLLPSPTSKDFELRTGKSVNVNFGIVKAQLSLYKHYINIVSGLTYDINNWSYASPINWNRAYTSTQASSTAFITRDSNSFRKNKLVTNYLQIPLLLRFETSPTHENKNVYISVGGYAGYLVRAHTKQIIVGSSDKHKQFDEFNITKLQYGMQFELGYQGISLVLKKSYTPLTTFGTEHYPYSFGLRLTGL